jgi:hypothetical protein
MGCSVHTGLSGVPKFLKLVWLQLWDVENFISFQKVQDHRNRSSELKVMAKIRQASTGYPVHTGPSGAPSSEAPTTTFNG